MNTQEYIKKVCSKCEYKYNDRDICEIRHTHNNTYKCVYFKKCTLWERIKRLLKQRRIYEVIRNIGRIK